MEWKTKRTVKTLNIKTVIRKNEQDRQRYPIRRYRYHK